jgi:hypothetical protein
MAQSAAGRVGPVTHGAADRITPLAHSAADRIAPLATGAVERVSPYAQQAASRVSPYAHQAAERIAPIATSAKQRGARVAHDAVEKFGPALDEAFERVSPAVESARDKMSSEILPKFSEALSAAAGTPVVVEVTKRGKAAVAAAKGELELPTEKKKKKSRWLKRLAVVAAIAGVAVVVVRKFLGAKDADWQAARPTTPYTPPRQADTGQATGAGGATAAAGAVDEMDEAHEDPQGGMSAHLFNLEADGAATPDQPAEGGEYDAPADMASLVDEAFDEATAKFGTETPAEATSVDEQAPAETTTADESPVGTAAADEALAGQTPVGDEGAALLGETAAAPDVGRPRYEGEGVYVGREPPEGFTIKGNERSMKYHVPESAGYGRTVAEVWFNSEEAAQQAGFIRAQR